MTCCYINKGAILPFFNIKGTVEQDFDLWFFIKQTLLGPN
jgi:hypothetical protein